MSLAWTEHLMILPVLLPLLVAALLVLINESRHQLKLAINLVTMLLLLATATTLLLWSDNGHWAAGMGVYLPGNWPAPFGIVLVVDRLSALMLLLSAIMGTSAVLYSMLRWSRIGVHFHTKFLLLMMGINGTFLTNDLFNLFVFFEVMLAASYGLLLHGYNLERIRAGMQFIAVNLVASLLFLIGIALIYAGAGTLNMADLAARLGPTSLLDPQELIFVQSGAGAMVIAFLIKGAMWPLCFWLPTAYAAASPPVAAMFVLMTKVGSYAILRLWLLMFGATEEGVLAGFGFTALFWGGIITIFFGAAGMLATEIHGRLAGYGAIVSSGTLLAVLGLQEGALVTAGLFYLLSSTLALGAFMMLIELIDRSRNPLEALLAVTMQAFEIEEAPDQPVGVGIPGALAFIGISFAGCALIMTGLPPLSGFVAKFGLFHALLGAEQGAGMSVMGIAFMALILFAGLAAIIALMRYGIKTFWASGAVPAKLQLPEVGAIAILLTLCVGLTVFAAPTYDFLARLTADLQQPSLYVESILNAPVKPGPYSQGALP